MNRLELLYGYQKTESGLKVYADMHHVNQNTMTRWIRQFLLHGLAGVRHRSFNHRYSLNTKIEAVKEYQAGFPGEKIIEKYDIRSLSQLKQWSIQYNNDELKTKSRKRVRKMGRKVSFEEKCKIVQWVLDHDNDYQGATIQFNVSYQRVYSWVHKYHEAVDSWEALKDNRGGEATGRYQAVQELINETAGSVSELTKIAKVSRKSYYQWLKRQPTQREIENQAILEATYQIEKRHQNCAGYKKVTAILNNENGKNQEIPEYTFSFDFRINIKRVRRIMRKHGIKADVRQKKRSRKKEQQQYQEDNLLERKFIQIAPNLVWVSDTTELTYGRNNKVRLHVVLDLYGRYALSYHISPTETAEAAIEAFKRAAKQAGTFAPMIHTDRGAAYTSKDFNNYLTSNNSKHSLSAPGTPADNAVIEHYWGDFKYIWMAHHSHPQTLAELKDLVKQGVEYFNTVEISSKRNNLTAEDFRNEAV